MSLYLHPQRRPFADSRSRATSRRHLEKNFRRGWFWLIQTSLAASDSTGRCPKQKRGTLVDCSMRVKDRRFLLLLTIY